jgi:hypothetical protein
MDRRRVDGESLALLIALDDNVTRACRRWTLLARTEVWQDFAEWMIQ